MQLINNLQDPALFDHPIDKFEVIETHISWVLLTGKFVYKIKKPVNFGFLDFSTLEKRCFYCNEELRLNRRLAPELYLDVVAIHGSEEHPGFGDHQPVIEYAVKMRQFPQSSQLDRLLERQGFGCDLMEKLAEKIANFHLSIESASEESEFGDVEQVKHPVLENFEQIRTNFDLSNETQPGNSTQSVAHTLALLEQWSRRQLDELSETIQQRKQKGYIRECHGDMHLRNIALWDSKIVIFDCIEFNPDLYWIDVISEIAFLIMDLEDRQQELLAMRFLNRYMEITGDYEGVKLLRFYKVYRAMVRAKVAALRIHQEQPGSDEYRQTYQEFYQYLQLAEKFISPAAPCLLINHGLSGSGKSFSTRVILEKYPAIQIRSDVERKRLFQVEKKVDSRADIEQGIYTSAATEMTYTRLVDIARWLLVEGYSVVVDAANLKSDQRQLFIELAKSLHVAYFILDFQATVDTLRERVIKRAEQAKDVSDATLQVLEHQIENYEKLLPEEKPFTIEIDTGKTIDVEYIIKHIQASAIKF
jgi:aminoglycoside phosphotransferase family enzyme/predicted kinase